MPRPTRNPIRPDWPLGPVLRAAREKAQLTQLEAADLAEISVNSWAVVETGYRGAKGGGVQPANPNRMTITAAADAVGLDRVEALRLAGYGTPEQAAPPEAWIDLRERRATAGWSQPRLAAEAGVDQDAISDYETGRRRAVPETYRKLRAALPGLQPQPVTIQGLVQIITELAEENQWIVARVAEGLAAKELAELRAVERYRKR